MSISDIGCAFVVSLVSSGAMTYLFRVGIKTSITIFIVLFLLVFVLSVVVLKIGL